MKIKKLLLILSLAIFLSSCQLASPGQTAKVAPTPAKDKATVVGKVLSLTGSKPYANTVIFLCLVHTQNGESALMLDTSSSPAAKTDAEGNFVFTNIAPADYAMVVGDPMISYVIVPEEKDKNKARVWTAAANKVLDLGTLQVDMK